MFKKKLIEFDQVALVGFLLNLMIKNKAENSLYIGCVLLQRGCIWIHSKSRAALTCFAIVC